MGLKAWRKVEPSFSPGNQDATVHSPPVGCQMETHFHGGYLTMKRTQAVAKPGSEAVYCCLAPAPSFFLLSEAGTQERTTKAPEKTLPNCPAMAGKD